MVNPNVLSQRYATDEINHIFSEEGKVLLERDLWLVVLKAQRELGLEIPESAITAYENAKSDINLKTIKEIEMRNKHDVKAKIEAYNLVAGGVEYIHMGMTSRDLTENVEQLQILNAARIIHGKYVSVLRHFLEKIEEYRYIEIVARTHHQAAQPTLLGRRFAMWTEELSLYLKKFEQFIGDYPFRGIKGPVGTQFDMVNLLGSKEKAEKLEDIVALNFGIKKSLDTPGQVYPRSLDYILTSHLAALASACENFAKTMRLMAGYELVTEGFIKGQVGSSVMPHKMNTRNTERICALAELQKMYADGASRISGDQWEEGDVSCSAIRRIIIPDAFYTADGLVETTLNVLNLMGVYPAVIERELKRYMPFLASTSILTLALKHGIGREKAHNIIKKYAIAEALRIREAASKENRLVKTLSEDPEFKDKGITIEELQFIIDNRNSFIDNAQRQIDQTINKTKKIIERYTKAASYEPGDII